MEFIQINRAKNSTTSTGTGSSSISTSSYVPLNYLELIATQNNIKAGIIKKTIESSGGFGTVTGTGITPTYLLDESGFIFSSINTSGITTPIASIDVNGNANFKGLRLTNGTDVVNLIVDENGSLSVDNGINSSGEIAAFGIGSGGSGTGGGLIQNVFGYGNLGNTFDNTVLTDTFNAYTINKMNDRLVNVENGSATSVTTTGSGNAITSLTKSGNLITANKGADFLTGISYAQVIAALNFTPYNNTNPSGYSTTAYVDQKITDLINGAPSNLDTLKEISDALSGETSAINALITTVGTKANQSSELAYDLSTNNYKTADVHLAYVADSANYAVNAGDSLLFNGQNSTYYAAASSLGNYLPLAGGTITGNLNVNGNFTLGTSRAVPTPNTMYVAEYSSTTGFASYRGNWDSPGNWGFGANTNLADSGVRIGTVGGGNVWAADQSSFNLNVGNLNVDNNITTQKVTVGYGSASGIITTDSAKDLLLQIAGISVVSIKNGGNVLIGTTTDNGNKFQVNGNSTFNGNITATGEVTAYSSSDNRLKENIKPIEKATDIINKLNPVTYNWNEKAIELNSNKSIDKTDAGLIAQELKEVLPELVKPMYDGEYLGVDYVKLIPYLIQSIKELTTEINKLKNK